MAQAIGLSRHLLHLRAAYTLRIGLVIEIRDLTGLLFLQGLLG